MLSFSKILFTLVLIAVVFYGAKLIGRRVGATAAKAPKAPKAKKATAKSPPKVETVDLSKCPACDSFIADDAGNCGRGDCPRLG